MYLNKSLNNSINFENLPFENTEPNKDRSKIETASGSKTYFKSTNPVSNKKTENELKTDADLTDPDMVNKLIKIGNRMLANENKSVTSSWTSR